MDLKGIVLVSYFFLSEIKSSKRSSESAVFTGPGAGGGNVEKISPLS